MKNIKKIITALLATLVLSTPLAAFAGNAIYVDTICYDIVKISTDAQYKTAFQTDIKDGGKIFIEYNGKVASILKVATSGKKLADYVLTNDDRSSLPGGIVDYKPNGTQIKFKVASIE